ncbi:MAG: hypothetical protein FJ211_10905, partial [Ignavibacteria bacterium]|nr:hypothetical protein [Ignavibacteria bacterium]
LSNLAAGTYTVTITESNGCTVTGTTSFTITQPAAVVASGTQVNNTCNGASAGSIDLSVVGGSGSYTYLWSNGATTQDLSNLAAGTYTVTITESNGCTVTGTTSFTITQPAAVVASGTQVNVTGCFGNSNGSIDLSVVGGSGSYTYSWSNGSSVVGTTQDISNLAAGTYTVTITESNGCTVTGTTSFTITQPSQLTVADDGITDAFCANSSDGAIGITVTGGTPNGSAPLYSYAWTGPNSFTSTNEDQNFNLAPGPYAVTVTDANGCTATLSNLVVGSNPAIVITASATNVTCNGGTTGSINATVSGGVAPYSYSWTGPNGYTSSSEDPSGLAAGNYVLTVTDDNFCSQTSSTITLTQPALLSATVAAASASVCSGANAVFTLTGTATQVVTYKINNGANTTATIGAGGTATVTINNATTTQTLTLVSVSNGACSNAVSGNASVSILDLPTANAGNDQTVCSGTQVTLTGASNGTIAWDNSVTDGTAFTVTNNTNAPTTITYTLTATGSNGCTNTDQVVVTINPLPTVS